MDVWIAICMDGGGDRVNENAFIMSTRKLIEIHTKMLLYCIRILPSLLHLNWFLLSNNSRTSVGHMKKLLAHTSFSHEAYVGPVTILDLSEDDGSFRLRFSNGEPWYWRWGSGCVTSSLVLDIDLVRSCEDPRCRGPRELLKGRGVQRPAG